MQLVDVSIVLPFRDHEHLVGRASRSIAEHFTGLGLSFEIVAVDEGSGDNSHALLALLRQEIPSLRVVVGQGYEAGSRKSVGKSVVLMEISIVAEGLTRSLSQAVESVLWGNIDMQLVAEHLLVCTRDSLLELQTAGLARRQRAPRSLIKRARAKGLNTRSYGPESSGLSNTGLRRIISALVPRAAGPHSA